MKKKLLILVVSLVCLVMTGAMVFMAMSMANTATNNAQKTPTLQNLAEETPTFNTTTPVYIYDFTDDKLEKSFAYEMGMSHTFTDGQYITFKSESADPYCAIQTPTALPSQMKYVVIVHRGNVSNIEFEFFFTHTNTSANFGPTDTNYKVKLTSTGDWSSAIARTGWADAATTAKFSQFRIDPMSGSSVKSGDTIDVMYIAFFESEADAQGFNYQQYKAKQDYEAAQKEAEKEASKDVNWANPEFVEQDTTGLDLSDGTLKYETSADGKTVTISYQVNGETKSYTVPNNNNFTSGSMAATDDLGRTLYDANTVGLWGSNGERYTGLFYFLWQGEHGDSGIFDLQKIIDEYGEDAASLKCGAYGAAGQMHWFAEPLYGYYYANDAWVLRKHAELLCNINIDFLYFDVTNAVTYTHNALALMEVLHQLNEEGYDAPQVVFYTNTNAVQTVRTIYNQVYAKNKYPDTWFCIDGKPVIIAPEEANINGFFTTKQNQWPNEKSKTNGWPWMDFDWPQRVFYDHDGDDGAVSVSVAQHCGSIRFSSSSLYNDNSNRGRSFTAEEGVRSGSSKYNRALKLSYNAWKEDQTLTMQGLNFQAQWDHAISTDAKYVLVTGWNEWVAQRQDPRQHNMPSDYVFFVDTSSMEFSRDCEMMRGGYFDNYYIQLAYNVQKLNGTAPVIVQDARMPINVTGEFNQWDKVTVTYHDPSGDTVERDATGFGHTNYTNDTGRNDIVASKVVTDSKYIYFYAQTKSDITMFDTKSSWMQLYVNTDSAETGWYGYDYIINYQAKDSFTTTVASYNGKDGAYGFKSAGEVSYRVKDNQIMIAVPLEMLGIEGYKEINVQFKWADSTTKYDEMEDFYIDGDAAPLGRMNYVYQNYIPGVSEITYPEVEQNTTASEETVADIDTTPVEDTQAPATEAETVLETEVETGDNNGGCASVIGATAILFVAMAAAVVLKKKDE